MSGGPDTFKGDYLPAAKICGASHSFSKPLNWDELLAAISEVLPNEAASGGT